MICGLNLGPQIIFFLGCFAGSTKRLSEFLLTFECSRFYFSLPQMGIQAIDEAVLVVVAADLPDRNAAQMV